MPNALITQLKTIMRQHATRKAIISGEDSITFCELDELSEKIAHQLDLLGAGPEKIVCLCLSPSILQVASIIAVFKTNAAYVPIDPELPLDRIQQILNDADPIVIITDKNLPFDSLKCLQYQNHFDLDNEPLGNIDEKTHYHPDNLAYIIYTSGSTGAPKGVMVEHKSLNNLMESMNTLPTALTPEDCFIQNVSYSFDPSLWTIFWPLVSGATLIIPQNAKDISEAIRLIQQYKIRIFHSGPTMLKLLLSDSKMKASSSMRCIIGGGEAWSAELLKNLNKTLPEAMLVNVYGPTETTIHVTTWVADNKEREKLPIGKPIQGCTIYMLDEFNQPVANGVTGEICVTGIPVSRGYKNNPVETSQRFIPNPFSADIDHKILYKTGDVGKFLEDGNIAFLGRLDEQVKIRGYRIQLEEINFVVTASPGVENSSVIVTEGHQKLVAFVQGKDLCPQTLKAICSKKLPDYMIPAEFIVIKTMPINASAKIDKNALKELYQHYRDSNSIEVSSSEFPVDGCLLIWKKILQNDQINSNSNFFENGGDSLNALDIVLQIEEIFGIEIEIMDIFNNPTPIALGNFIQDKLATA